VFLSKTQWADPPSAFPFLQSLQFPNLFFPGVLTGNFQVPPAKGGSKDLTPGRNRRQPFLQARLNSFPGLDLLSLVDPPP